MKKIKRNMDGQMIVLSGFILALALLLITIMLNNIIFVGNIASEGSMDTFKNDVMGLKKMTIMEVNNAADNASEGGSWDGAIFARYMSNYTSAVSDIYVYSGQLVNISFDTNPVILPITTPFSILLSPFNDSGTANWTIQNNIVNITTFLVNFTNYNTTLNGVFSNYSDADGKTLKINLTDETGSEKWKLIAYNNSTHWNVSVWNNTGWSDGVNNTLITNPPYINLTNLDLTEDSYKLISTLNTDQNCTLSIGNGIYVNGNFTITGTKITENAEIMEVQLLFTDSQTTYNSTLNVQIGSQSI
ncbi:MAG: hypothetical protein SVM80_07590 [Halobacteriota archaeon]|nr:hypothetical protein [Halobacteriota archaeon]